MRTTLCPNWTYVTENKQALLEECKYYGLEYMQHRVRGETSPYDLRPQDRTLKEQEALAMQNPSAHADLLLDVFDAGNTALDPGELQLPLLPTQATRASVRGTHAEFLDRLDKLSGGLVRELGETRGLVFAGGSVLAALTDGDLGDVDIFLCCQKDEAVGALKGVFRAAQRLHRQRQQDDAAKLLVTRSKHAVTIFSHPPSFPPIQVILSVYDSPLSLLLDFDVDCCCCAYIPGEKRVVCTPRGLRALRYGANIVDCAFDGLGYHRRLLKYDLRGFGIAVPGFEPRCVSRRLREGKYILLEKYDLLLRAEPSEAQDINVTVSTRDDAIGRRVKPTAVRRCSSIRGFERTVVLKYAKVQRATAAELENGFVRPVLTQGGKYTTLFYGLDEREDEGDGENYSTSPTATVRLLLQQLFDSRLQGSSETPQSDFEWWTGGAMQKFARQPIKDATRTAWSSVQADLRNGAALHFVYDVCMVETPFTDLKFVLDAGRNPLRELDEDNFEGAYGIARTLRFKASEPRARNLSDMWASVYA
jgi:hypothetical protein